MIFLAFYLGGFIATMGYGFISKFTASHSVKELWNSMKLLIFGSFFWPIVLLMSIYDACFRDPKKKDTNEDHRWRPYK